MDTQRITDTNNTDDSNVSMFLYYLSSALGGSCERFLRNMEVASFYFLRIDTDESGLFLSDGVYSKKLNSLLAKRALSKAIVNLQILKEQLEAIEKGDSSPRLLSSYVSESDGCISIGLSEEETRSILSLCQV